MSVISSIAVFTYARETRPHDDEEDDFGKVELRIVLSKVVIGMKIELSRDWPRILPSGSITPMTLKRVAGDLDFLVERIFVREKRLHDIDAQHADVRRAVQRRSR